MTPPAGEREWLESNASGSFALGCVDRKLRRKYHSLLTVREPGSGDPWNVVAEVAERLHAGDATLQLCDPYSDAPGLELTDFRECPHPVHRYSAGGLSIERRVRLGPDQVELRYRFHGVTAPLELELEPLLRVRPLHELTYQNPFLDGAVTAQPDGSFTMRPYIGMPSLSLRVYGTASEFREQGAWHSGIYYEWEAARGYEAHEDLFSPGHFSLAVDADCELTLVIGFESCRLPAPSIDEVVEPNFAAKLERGVARYVMQSRAGVTTVIAGFPWFGPWSRDTLIALPGVYLATSDFSVAASILDGLAEARIDGLIPNIPAIAGTVPDTCSVDASLLFVRALHWLSLEVGKEPVARFMPVAADILEALIEGSDPRMRLDEGMGVYTQPGPWALTWMDAVIDGRPVTPRAGYAVDIDALAHTAARFVLPWAQTHRPALAQELGARLRTAQADFLARYWDDTRGYLADAHNGERADVALRPNQLWALAEPFELVPHALRRSALTAVRRALLVPAGLRTLSPEDPHYRGHYRGAQLDRDAAYHQGTVWPWLLGVYADAVATTWGRDALEEQLSPALSFMVQHVDHEACLGQISELFDGDFPHAPGGAPCQAWSIAEVYRVLRMLHASTHVLR